MTMTPTERAHDAWRQADKLKRLSDRLIGVGPFSIGLDGVLAWIPGVNFIYGAIAGTIMLVHGLRARASLATLGRMIAYVIIDNVPDVLTVVPGLSWLAGSLFDTIFRGHLMAANALQKDIEARHGLPADVSQSRTSKKQRRRDPAPA